MFKTTITAKKPKTICQQWVAAAEAYLAKANNGTLEKEDTIALYVDTAAASKLLNDGVGGDEFLLQSHGDVGAWVYQVSIRTQALLSALEFGARLQGRDYSEPEDRAELEKYLLGDDADLGGAVETMTYAARELGIRTEKIGGEVAPEPFSDELGAALKQRQAALGLG